MSKDYAKRFTSMGEVVIYGTARWLFGKLKVPKIILASSCEAGLANPKMEPSAAVHLKTDRFR